MSGFDSFRLLSAFCLLDVWGRFARANFVGYVCKCGSVVDKPVDASLSHSYLEPLRPLFDYLHFSGFALLSFAVGPMLFQNFYVGYCLLRSGGIRWTLARAKAVAQGKEQQFLAHHGVHKECPP